MNKNAILIISIILLSLIPLVPGYAEETNWIFEERGADFSIYYDSTTPNRKSWNSEPLWIYNGSHYLPYIYYRDEAKKCYTVQSGLIGFELYDAGIATFYDPDLIEERVKSERWELWYLDGSVWKEASLSSTISFTVLEYQYSIIIEAERATSKPDGILNIKYQFVQGQPLKHEITWTSQSTETEIVQVRQVWDLKLSTDKVILDNGALLTTSTITNSATYLFGDNNNDFLVLEDQWSATYYPDGTLRENGRFTQADIDFAGKKVTFTFSNWTLTQNAYLTIDPYTATLTPPTKDTWIQTEANNGGDTSLKIQGRVGAGIQRLLLEFDISSIPSYATFSLGRLDLYCSSESNDEGEVHQWRRITGAWEEMVVVWSNQPAITETNGVNLAAPTSSGWHNITITDMVSDARGAGTILGIRGKDSIETRDYTSYTTFHSKEGVNDPRLYLEYTLPEPIVSSAQITNMDNPDDLFPMYRWYEFEVVTDYIKGADEIRKVYLRGKDGANTIFEVRGDSLDSTPAWSIQTGANIIDLDTGSCSWQTNGDTGTATFKIRIEYDHTQYSNLEIDAYAEDIDEVNSGWVNKQTDYFDIITNLVTTFNLDDDRGNLSQSVTASGQINFEGSSLYPSNSNFTSVSVYDSSNNNEGTDSTIVNGAWSVNFDSPSSVGIDTYNLYIDMADTEYSDGEETSPTDTFINDRYNVTQFWASSYDLQTGENATLYAIFESEYDSHICDGDDSITIEDLQFSYDPIEEYYFVEIGKDEAGTYYFDTLNYIYENTYEVYDGNLDYNLSIAWCDYHYEFYGLYYENGTYAGNVTMSVYFEDSIETFTLEGEAIKNYEEMPLMFVWPLTGGASRTLYTIDANETYYIFTPDDEYSTYSFTVKDYTGVIGDADSYLEILLNVNGTVNLIERDLIWDTANPVTAVLQKDNRYKLQIRDGTGAVHIFDYYLPITGFTPELIIDEIAFTEQVHYIGEYVSVEAVRPDYEHIQINYKDERSATSSIFVEVCLMNQTQIWNDTSTDQYVQFNWYDAINTTDYLINLVAQHTIVDEVYYSNALAGYYEQYDDPPDMSIFGKSGKYLVPVGILMIILAVADASTAKMVTTAMVGVAYILRFIGWLDVPVMGIHLSLFLVGAWWLSGRN